MFSKIFKKAKNTDEQKIVIDAKAFKPLLKEEFSPTLRRYGFKGTGFKYKKVNGRYIYSLTIQPSIYGGKCYVEMGVAIDGMSLGTFEPVPIEKISPYDSHFRTRLTRSNNNESSWEYGDTLEYAKSSAKNMANDFIKYGLTFYEQFKNFPYPLNEITIKDIEEYSDIIKKLHPQGSLHMLLARFYISNGDKRKGIEFAKAGYAKVDKTIRKESEYVKDPKTGSIKVLGKTPIDIIAIYEKLMRGELA